MRYYATEYSLYDAPGEILLERRRSTTSSCGRDISRHNIYRLGDGMDKIYPRDVSRVLVRDVAEYLVNGAGVMFHDIIYVLHHVDGIIKNISSI